MNSAIVEAKIIIFIVEQTSANLEKICWETRLGEDLGIDGDDASEFFENFSKEFEVDLSNFQFDKYFGSEAGFDLLLAMWQIFFDEPKQKLETITVKDLITAAIAKKWNNKPR